MSTTNEGTSGSTNVPQNADDYVYDELDRMYVDAARALYDGQGGGNGEVEAGIAAGSDKNLTEKDRLNVCTGIPQYAAAINAASHYLSIKYPGTDPANVTLNMGDHFMVLAAFFIVACNLMCTYGENDRIDGDVIRTSKISSTGRKWVNTVTSVINAPGFNLSGNLALTIVLATKVNWFLTNHHTGSGVVQGFVKKVVDARKTDLSRETTLIHQAGHWASTLKVCTRLGVRGVRPIKNIVGRVEEEVGGVKVLKIGEWVGAISLIISPDISIRLNEATFPAGTHRTQLAWAGVRLIYAGPLAPLFPAPHHVVTLASNVAKIKEKGASYHMGGRYLTGDAKADYDDLANCLILGKVGSYLIHLHKNHTLTSSPHILKGQTRVFESYTDFDGSWDNICTAYSKMRVKCKPSAVEVVLGISGSGVPGLTALNRAYGATGNGVMRPDAYAQLRTGLDKHVYTPGDDDDEDPTSGGSSGSGADSGATPKAKAKSKAKSNSGRGGAGDDVGADSSAEGTDGEFTDARADGETGTDGEAGPNGGAETKTEGE